MYVYLERIRKFRKDRKEFVINFFIGSFVQSLEFFRPHSRPWRDALRNSNFFEVTAYKKSPDSQIQGLRARG